MNNINFWRQLNTLRKPISDLGIGEYFTYVFQGLRPVSQNTITILNLLDDSLYE